MERYQFGDGGEVFKRCPNCKEYKELSRFAKNKSSKDGRDSWCSDCNKKRLASRRAANRGPVDAFMLSTFGNVCEKCGEVHELAVLQGHHIVSGQKETTLRDIRLGLSTVPVGGKAWMKHVAAALKEKEICIILCPNCHAYLHHWARQSEEIVPDDYKPYVDFYLGRSSSNG